jgi:hypothetical protein
MEIKRNIEKLEIVQRNLDLNLTDWKKNNICVAMLIKSRQ